MKQSASIFGLEEKIYVSPVSKQKGGDNNAFGTETAYDRFVHSRHPKNSEYNILNSDAR
jgi:hypothetical protein